MDRQILLFGGVIGTMIVRLLMFPLPGGDHPPTPPAAPEDLTTDSFGRLLSYSSDLGPGFRNQDCETTKGEAPLCTHDWCETQPAINLAQHITSILLSIITYAMCQGSLQSLVSKILGPRPQVPINFNCLSLYCCTGSIMVAGHLVRPLNCHGQLWSDDRPPVHDRHLQRLGPLRVGSLVRGGHGGVPGPHRGRVQELCPVGGVGAEKKEGEE